MNENIYIKLFDKIADELLISGLTTTEIIGLLETLKSAILFERFSKKGVD